MGGTPILSHFSPILAILKIFTSVLTFLGGKIFFLQKCPKSGLVSFKKYIVLRNECNKCYIFLPIWSFD